MDAMMHAASDGAKGRVDNDQETQLSQGWIMARKLEPMMRDVMDGYLYNVRYQPDRCSKLAKDICEVIKVNTLHDSTTAALAVDLVTDVYFRQCQQR
jgi:hypothetical protein